LIARGVGIAEGTVKVHLKQLLKKLNLRSWVEVAVRGRIGAGSRPSGDVLAFSEPTILNGSEVYKQE